jgi:hypothetical protein
MVWAEGAVSAVLRQRCPGVRLVRARHQVPPAAFSGLRRESMVLRARLPLFGGCFESRCDWSS